MMPLFARLGLSPATLWIIVGIAGLFLMAFYVQVTLLWPYDNLPGISLLFLPHGIRVLAVLIGRGLSMPGLFLGNMMVSWGLFHDLGVFELVTGFCAAVMPFLALRCVEMLTGEVLTDRFSVNRLIGLVLCSALFNTVSHILLFSLFNRYDSLPGLSALGSMVTGDIAGGLLLIGVLWIVIKSTRDLVVPAALGRSTTPVTTAYMLMERTGVVAGGLFVAYQLPFIVDQSLLGTPQALGMAPILIAVISLWQYRVSALPGLFLGVLTLAPDYVVGPLPMLGFAGIFTISCGLALALVQRVWGLPSEGANRALLRFSMVLLLLLASSETWYLMSDMSAAALSAYWSQIVVTGVVGLMGVLWPLLWVFARVRAIR